MKKVLVNVLSLMLALTFTFSGVTKLIDPYGTAYKIEDYAGAMGLAGVLPSFVPLVMSVVLAVCEFTIGVLLLFGVRRRMNISCMLVFLLLATPLTLYLAIANPISDCGCFGDALVLTNWQSFFKNVVLLTIAFCVWGGRKDICRFISETNQWTLSLYTWVFAFCFACHNIYYLPVIDFRPYHVGADVRTQWTQGDGTEFDTFFILEKDGERKEFTLDDYPDSTWTFVDSYTVQRGGSRSHSGVQDFTVISMESGEDITSSILDDKGYTFLLVSPYIEKADDGVMDRLSAIYEYSLDRGCPFYCLTSSGTGEVLKWQDITGAEYPFCHADATLLKTMVRSNPGLVLLYDGVVVGKWPSTDLPSEEDLDKVLATDKASLVSEGSRREVDGAEKILLWYLVPLLLLTLADRARDLWKKRFANKNTNQKKVTDNEKEDCCR